MYVCVWFCEVLKSVCDCDMWLALILVCMDGQLPLNSATRSTQIESEKLRGTAFIYAALRWIGSRPHASCRMPHASCRMPQQTGGQAD